MRKFAQMWTTTYILIVLGEREGSVSFNITMLIWIVSIVIQDIPIKKGITNERFPHCIHEVRMFVHHGHMV